MIARMLSLKGPLMEMRLLILNVVEIKTFSEDGMKGLAA